MAMRCGFGKALVLAWLLAACGAAQDVTVTPLPKRDFATFVRLDELASTAAGVAPFLGHGDWKPKGAPALLGLAMSVHRKGVFQFQQGYGASDFDGTPVTEDTVFQIGSLTKQFTAACVLRLVDEGKVRLDDPVSRFVPAFGRAVTIAQLLHQTSGIPDYAHEQNLGKSTTELVAVIAQAPPDFAPGERFAYSNSNYFLLGRVVEQASGMTYADYIRDRLAPAAGLKATRTCGGPGGARGSQASGDRLVPVPAFDLGFYDAAGALCSTVRDLQTWQDALFGGKLLHAETLAFMTTPATLTDGSKTKYGAGLVIDTFAGHRRFWHNGAVPSGFESELAFLPDDHLQIVLLTNTLHTPPGVTLGRLDGELTRVALGLPEPKVLDLPIDPALIAKVTGTYAVGTLTAEIRARDGQLFVELPGAREVRLFYQGHGTFDLGPYAAYRFVLEGGRATGFEVIVDGEVQLRVMRVAAP